MPRKFWTLHVFKQIITLFEEPRGHPEKLRLDCSITREQSVAVTLRQSLAAPADGVGMSQAQQPRQTVELGGDSADALDRARKAAETISPSDTAKSVSAATIDLPAP